MGKKKRIKKIIEFVENERDRTLEEKPKLKLELTYRWKHTLRVAQRGMKIAEQENGDVEIVVAACLLHDIAKLANRSNGVNHGRVGAKMIKSFLKKEIGYSNQKAKAIRYAIASHVDGKAGFDHPETLEADIVNDADKLDRFSAYRMMLALDGKIENYDKLIADARRYLKVLRRYRRRSPLRTKSGRKRFKKELDIQIVFLEKLIAESELTTPPTL